MMLPSVADIEQACLKAWPAIDTASDGKWVLRAAGGYTKRANSVQSLDPGDDADAAPRLERATRWYRDRGLPPVFRVTPLAGDGILTELDKAWTAFDHSLVLAMDLGPLAFAADENTALLPVTSPDWLRAQQRLQGYDEATVGRLARIVERIKAPVRGLIHYGEDANPSASALMVVVNGLVFANNVVTAGHQRRRGFARTLLASGLAWARQAGGRRAGIQVLASNTPAIMLYEGLGYVRHYEYHYRRPDR
jgi:ribosomal protein S18 acetylase RimI-like enzyme